jgi:hypothetical protein
MSLPPEVLTPVHITPVALFQIIKHIRTGPAIDCRGSLYGMPSDPADPTVPIEVTAAFPSYAPRFTKPASEQQADEYGQDVEQFTREHLHCMSKLNGDTFNVGWYTWRHAGRRLAADDLRLLFDKQKERLQSFALVVDIDDASISVRAFKISQGSMDYLERTDYFGKSDPTQIDPELLFKNLVVSPPVTFQLTPLEQVILDQMLESFSLIADVFRLRNLETMKKELVDLTDTMDELRDNLMKTVDDKAALVANRAARQRWIDERNEANEKRRLHKRPELPLDELDAAVPLQRPISKHPIIFHTYQYNAKSTALSVAVEEEKTKMTALAALGDTQ